MEVTATFAEGTYTYFFTKEDVYDCMRFFGCSEGDALYHLAYTEYSNSVEG